MLGLPAHTLIRQGSLSGQITCYEKRTDHVLSTPPGGSACRGPDDTIACRVQPITPGDSDAPGETIGIAWRERHEAADQERVRRDRAPRIEPRPRHDL